MKQAICSGLLCLLTVTFAWKANAQGTDTVLTTKGAVTLITCASPITTFQIGDGKNADYDYRIVDGNMAFVRPTVPYPRPTNLIVREGDNIHYLILHFRDKADLARLKYTLSTKGGVQQPIIASTAGSNTDKPSRNRDRKKKEKEKESQQEPMPANRPNRVGDSGGVSFMDLPEPDTYGISVDTVTVSKIAEDFMKDRKPSRQYETKVEGVVLSYAHAMTLNNLNYFCYQVKNKSKVPYTIAKVALLHKAQEDSAQLHGMPILYRRGPATVGAKDESNFVFVVPARQFKKEDEVIMVLQTPDNTNQLVLYLPVSQLPKYMVTK